MPLPMSLFWFFDAPAAAIVLGGTLLGTLLRCGMRDAGAARRALAGLVGAGLGRPGFDADAVRRQLAMQIQQINRDGLLRARPRAIDDAEFAQAADALIGQRSLAALLAAHKGHSARRMAQASAAVRTLAQAAELAPVAGLAGTLVALARLPADGIARSAFLVAIGMAVHATLYGLITAHLLLMPLAAWVERAALAEEQARAAVVEWLAGQVTQSCPRIATPEGPAAPRRAARKAGGARAHPA